MFHNLCPGTLGIKGLDFAQQRALALKYGFGGIDFAPEWTGGDIGAARALGQQLTADGLRWGLFWLPCDFSACDDATYADGIEKLKANLPLVQAAGCTRTYNHLFPGHDTLPYTENRRRHVERLRPVAALLESFGVSYGFEFLGPAHMRAEKKYPFIHQVEPMAELAADVGHGAGVVFDFFHWYAGGGQIEGLRQVLAGTKIVNVHANDAALGVAREDQHNYRRELPLATGVIDAKAVVGVLKDLGYDGPVIAEPFSPQLARLSSQTPDQTAAEVCPIMKRLLAL